MTRTTSKTTRKAPWAAALTALLSVLALVFGALALAGVANADPGNGNGNDKTPPGQSETFTPPGQATTPPGQVDDGTPGNSDGVPGGGNDNTVAPVKVWVCHADTNNGNGNTNLGNDGTGGEYGIGYNIIEVSENAWISGHMGRHPNDKMFTTEAAALAACVTTPPPPPGDTITGSAGYSVPLCLAGTATPVTVLVGTKSETISGTDQAAANAAAAALWTDQAKTDAVNTFLAANGSYRVVPASGLCITEEQAGAIDAALPQAATLGALEPATVTAVEPGTIAPEPATVNAVEPATVAVPQKGTVAPAAVPAGDGSSTPPVPAYALVLLALGATALTGSALTLAKGRIG